MSVSFKINGRSVEVDVPDETALLWVIRDELDLKGTKFGCGIGACGACTVHIEGSAARSCITAVRDIAYKNIVTIEGLASANADQLRRAWLEENAPQCGYCQSGQILAAAALLSKHPRPTDEQINNAMKGILCRCGSYPRIRKAIHRAAVLMEE